MIINIIMIILGIIAGFSVGFSAAIGFRPIFHQPKNIRIQYVLSIIFILATILMLINIYRPTV